MYRSNWKRTWTSRLSGEMSHATERGISIRMVLQHDSDRPVVLNLVGDRDVIAVERLIAIYWRKKAAARSREDAANAGVQQDNQQD